MVAHDQIDGHRERRSAPVAVSGFPQKACAGKPAKLRIETGSFAIPLQL